MRKNHKDTAFRKLFSQSEYFLDLYRECSGKQLGIEEIRPFDLANDDRLFGVLKGSEMVNDVSYITADNKLIVLAEHQSTPNQNMPVRELLYYAALLRRWLANEGIDLSAASRKDIPLPEFYVAYNGKTPYNEKNLEFGNEFLRSNIKLVDIHFDKLRGGREDKDNSLAAYAYFYKHVDEKRAEGATVDAAVIYAGKQCKTAGYLEGKINWEDFAMESIPAFSYANDLRAEGRTEGWAKGKAEGKAEMLKLAMYSNAPYRALRSMAMGAGIGKQELVDMYGDFLKDQEKKGVQVSMTDRLEHGKDLSDLQSPKLPPKGRDGIDR